MDSQSTRYVEKYQQHIVSNGAGNTSATPDNDSDNESLSEMLEALEQDDEVTARYKEQRLSQLNSRLAAIDRAAAIHGDSTGKLHVVDSEQELMADVTSSEIAVVHFYQPKFAKCVQMNGMLEAIAERHLELNVLAIPAEKATFLVAKLKIKVLPFVVVYRNGMEIARIVGFEGVGGVEGVTVDQLETKLISCGAIAHRSIHQNPVSRQKAAEKDDSEDDWF